mmetsp:Transcript_36193/g.99916  ORF Transcript_36193/g.99916 Transcript_36193/m.99916 type:complete len:81 (+) Transcript_36193:1-243(+)
MTEGSCARAACGDIARRRSMGIALSAGPPGGSVVVDPRRGSVAPGTQASMRRMDSNQSNGGSLRGSLRDMHEAAEAATIR